MATSPTGGTHRVREAIFNFPQRGPYAGEIRWSKTDARCIAGAPFYRGGGMGYEPATPMY